MNKKIILFSIVILLILIIVISIIVFRNADEQRIEEYYSRPQEVGLIKDTNIKPVTSETMFYTVEGVLQKYLSYTNLDLNEEPDTNLQSTKTLHEVYKINNETEKKEAILNFLDATFKEDYSINVDNVDKIVNITSNGVKTCKAIEMNYIEDKDLETYCVYAQWQTNKDSKTNTGTFLIVLDKQRDIFSIKPIENDETNLTNITFESSSEIIEKNQQNKFTYIRLNEGEVATKYFNNYKELILSDPDRAYKMLNKDFKNVRFKTIEDFKKYIEYNKGDIQKWYISKYLCNKDNGTVEYVCKDGNGNEYSFKVKSVTDYSVKLDGYSTPSTTMEDKYTASTDEQKIAYNTDKLIQMINSRDYTTIYDDLLDSEFKQNKFPNRDNFIKYMQNKFPNYYGYESQSIEKQSNIFVQKLNLTDKNNSSDLGSELTIMMVLKEDSKFTISFSI